MYLNIYTILVNFEEMGIDGSVVLLFLYMIGGNIRRTHMCTCMHTHKWLNNAFLNEYVHS